MLDLGCGRGYWLRRMVRAGLAPVGIEYDPARAAEAGIQAPVAAGDAARLPLRDRVGRPRCGRSTSSTTCPTRRRCWPRSAGCCAPGGHLILAETVEDHPLIRLGRAVHPHWDGVGVHSRFRAATLLALLAAAGFEVVDSRQHSLVSFAAWALPVGDRAAWSALVRVESRLPVGLSRWGAHFEVVARRP